MILLDPKEDLITPDVTVPLEEPAKPPTAVHHQYLVSDAQHHVPAAELVLELVSSHGAARLSPMSEFKDVRAPA